MDLQDIRKQIDTINQEMLALFERRMELSRSVAAYKMEHGMDIFVPAREVEIMEWVQNTASSPELHLHDTAFFNTILELSRRYQAAYIDAHAPPKISDRGIKTDRLTLLPLEKNDATPVFSLTKDPEITRFMRFDTHATLADAEELIEEYATNGNLGYKVVLSENSEFIGVFAFKPETEHPEKIGISIFMAKEHWGKGYFREILEMAKAAAIDLLHGESLWAYVVEENVASCRALENAGFLLDAELKFDDWEGTLYVYCYDLEE